MLWMFFVLFIALARQIKWLCCFVRKQIMTQRERDTIIHLIAGGWVYSLTPLLHNSSILFFFSLFFINQLAGVFTLCVVNSHCHWLIMVELVCCFIWLNWTNRFAGTVGAIVTCPLEVVKTRLQSSSSQFYPQRMSDVANKLGTNCENFKSGTTQKREICTSILQKRSQVCSSLFVYLKCIGNWIRIVFWFCRFWPYRSVEYRLARNQLVFGNV